MIPCCKTGGYKKENHFFSRHEIRDNTGHLLTLGDKDRWWQNENDTVIVCVLETNPHVACTCAGALARVRMCAARNTRRDVFASAVDRGASTVEPAQVRLSFRFPRASSGECVQRSSLFSINATIA